MDIDTDSKEQAKKGKSKEKISRKIYPFSHYIKSLQVHMTTQGATAQGSDNLARQWQGPTSQGSDNPNPEKQWQSIYPSKVGWCKDLHES